jgi:opacity protein-like surface antigen
MKKILGLSCLALGLCQAAFAGNFYIGPSLFLGKVSASHSSYTNIHPRLSLGYGEMFDNYYAGVELFATPFSIDLSNNVNNGNISTKTTRSLGIAFIPGVMLNNTILGYARLGVVSTTFTAPDTMRPGVQVGLGLQSSLNDLWSIRGEYLFTSYRSMSGLGSPKSNEIGVGVIYKFDA